MMDPRTLEQPYEGASYRPTRQFGYGEGPSAGDVGLELFQRYEQFGEQHPYLRMGAEVAASRVAPWLARKAGLGPLADILDIAGKQWSPEGFGGGADIVTRTTDVPIHEILRHVKPGEKAIVRERIRDYVSAANFEPDLGPQNISTRVEAIKHAAGLSNKLMEKLKYLGRSAIRNEEFSRLAKPVLDAMDWGDMIGPKSRTGYGARLESVGLRPAMREKLLKDQPWEPIEEGWSLINHAELKLPKNTPPMTRVAARLILDQANATKQERPSPRFQTALIRHSLGVDNDLIKRLDNAQATVKNGRPGSEEVVKAQNWLVEYNKARDWIRDILGSMGYKD